MKDQLKTIREAAWVLREHNHLHFGSDHNTIAEADKITAALAQIEAMAGTQEPMFWVRLCRDGMYEGPIHNAQIERVRAQSGAWSPLFLSAAPVAQQPQAEAPVIAQNKAAPVASWNDSRTQKVYEVLTNDNYPPKGSEEHWEGWKARLVVDALFPEQPQAEAATSNEYQRNILTSVSNWMRTRSHTAWAEKFGYSSLMRTWADDLQAIAAPQQAEAVPIPAHELVTMYDERPTSDLEMIEFAREVERRHGIGVQPQHITNGSPCWCNPDVAYTDPETGASVIVHRRPQ